MIKLIIVSSFSLLASLTQLYAQSTTTNFENRMKGVYLDYKTQELVYLDSFYAMFYLAKANQTSKFIKIMAFQGSDSLQRTLNIQFQGSNYQCSFRFAPNFRTFVCTNPDGSQQLFRRTPTPINVSFDQFVKRFPVGRPRLFIPKIQKANRPIPMEMVMKFLIRDDHYHFFPLHQEMTLDEVRFGLYAATPQPNMFALNYYFNFHYAKRLPISNDFYTLLFYVTGGSSGELSADYTFLANFTKDGQFIDYAPVGYTKGMHIQYTTTATGKIIDNQITVNELQAYHNPNLGEGGSRNVSTTYRYEISPDGYIQLLEKASSNVTGVYEGVGNDQQLVVRSSGYYLEVGYGKKSGDLTNYKIVENQALAGRLVIKAPNTNQTWTLRFNVYRNEIILTKSDGSSQRFRRIQK